MTCLFEQSSLPLPNGDGPWPNNLRGEVEPQLHDHMNRETQMKSHSVREQQGMRDDGRIPLKFRASQQTELPYLVAWSSGRSASPIESRGEEQQPRAWAAASGEQADAKVRGGFCRFDVLAVNMDRDRQGADLTSVTWDGLISSDDEYEPNYFGEPQEGDGDAAGLGDWYGQSEAVSLDEARARTPFCSVDGASGLCEKPWLLVNTKVDRKSVTDCVLCHSPDKRKSRQRPCKGRRNRYHKFVWRMEQLIEGNPNILNEKPAQLPPSIERNVVLKSKLMRRLECYAEKAKQRQRSTALWHQDRGALADNDATARIGGIPMLASGSACAPAAPSAAPTPGAMCLGVAVTVPPPAAVRSEPLPQLPPCKFWRGGSRGAVCPVIYATVPISAPSKMIAPL